MMSNPKTHVSEAKKLKVKELAEQMKRKTVMIISIKGLPSAQFQDIKKKLRSKVKIQVAKKSLVDFALDHCGIKELQKLVQYVDDSTAILFSDEDAFEISGTLSSEKSPAKAKAGQIAPLDIEVKAGPTELIPGPDISALSAVGLAPKVENGKISVMKDKILVREGEVITEALASIMAKLDIIPFEVKIEPVAAYMNGIVYEDIKIDKDETLKELESIFGRTLSFAIEISYVNSDTINYIIGKAGGHEKALEDLIKEDVPAEEEKIDERVEKAAPTDTITDNDTNTEDKPGEDSSK
jgi:large subunit ribosomal protein L10